MKDVLTENLTPRLVVDPRAGTPLPVIAAICAVGAAIASIIIGYSQSQASDDLARYIGYWNMFVALAYLWLAASLFRRQEHAYLAGLGLAIANLAFVAFQVQLTYIASGITNSVIANEEQLTRVFFGFFGTDSLLVVATFLSFRDLVYPKRLEDIPDSPLLSDHLQQATEVSEPEKELLQDTRRRFIVHMSSRARGGIDINTRIKDHHVDLVSKSAFALLMNLYNGADENSLSERYLFVPLLDAAVAGSTKGAPSHIVAISATKHGIRKVGRTTSVYLLREQQAKKTLGASKDFEKFVQKEFGITFNPYKEAASMLPES
jgi:hypothetical protein